MKLIAFISVFWTCFAAIPLAAHDRVAIVIGNGQYRTLPVLRNPVNDTVAMAEKLRGLGFDVTEGYDLGVNEMRKTFRKFRDRAQDAEIVTVFFAGHGMAVEGVNYLIPVDAQLRDQFSWKSEVVDVLELVNWTFDKNMANIVILDACRDNPIATRLMESMGSTQARGVRRGLAPMDTRRPGRGMAIAFATSPGDVALDGKGRHSPFTSALLQHIATPNADITQVFHRVTGDVLERTNKKQRPWTSISLTGPVVLKPVDTTTQQPNSALQRGAKVSEPDLSAQLLVFKAAIASNDPADFLAYLNAYPNGVFADVARTTITRLQDPGLTERPGLKDCTVKRGGQSLC